MSPVSLEQENHERDAAFNKAMHGQSAKARGGMSAMLQKDKAAQQAAVDEYFKHWDNKAAADETEETRKVCGTGTGTAPRLRL
jgi:sterol 24-C-methyltransferase